MLFLGTQLENVPAFTAKWIGYEPSSYLKFKLTPFAMSLVTSAVWSIETSRTVLVKQLEMYLQKTLLTKLFKIRKRILLDSMEALNWVSLLTLDPFRKRKKKKSFKISRWFRINFRNKWKENQLYSKDYSISVSWYYFYILSTNTSIATFKSVALCILSTTLYRNIHLHFIEIDQGY